MCCVLGWAQGCRVGRHSSAGSDGVWGDLHHNLWQHSGRGLSRNT